MNCGRSLISPGTQVSSANKTDCHDITEILLKVALNTINQTIYLLGSLDFKINSEQNKWGMFISAGYSSVGNYLSPTRQIRVQNDFGEYLYPSTSHAGELACLCEIR